MVISTTSTDSCLCTAHITNFCYSKFVHASLSSSDINKEKICLHLLRMKKGHASAMFWSLSCVHVWFISTYISIAVMIGEFGQFTFKLKKYVLNSLICKSSILDPLCYLLGFLLDIGNILKNCLMVYHLILRI